MLHLENKIALRETVLPVAPSYSSNTAERCNVTLIFKSKSAPAIKKDIASMLLRIHLGEEFEYE